MDFKYLEKEFVQLHQHCYGNQEISIYVPTEEHSCGFNKVEIEDEGFGEYSIIEENESYNSDYYTFEEIINKYPKITLDREYAFYGKFVSWKDIELAFKGEKGIDLMRL